MICWKKKSILLKKADIKYFSDTLRKSAFKKVLYFNKC